MRFPASRPRPLVLLLLALAMSGPGMASDFSVEPMRLQLGATARSGVIAVRNEGQEKLSFQLQAREWTQNAEGQDQYTETSDLVFFPRLMTVEPGEEGVIRIGAKQAVVPVEKTYRIFIEELPGAARPAPQGKAVQVNVLIRFGAPIFVKPVKPEDGLQIEDLRMAGGTLSLFARNTGNQHQLVEGVKLQGVDREGREIYALTLADRYLLAGTRKRYSTTVPAEQCAKLAALSIEFKTDKATANQKLEIGPTMCR